MVCNTSDSNSICNSALCSGRYSVHWLFLLLNFETFLIKLLQTNFALYSKYAIDAKDSYQFIIMALLVSTVVSLPIWNLIIFKIGKKKTYAIGLVVSGFFYFLKKMIFLILNKQKYSSKICTFSCTWQSLVDNLNIKKYWGPNQIFFHLSMDNVYCGCFKRSFNCR